MSDDRPRRTTEALRKEVLAQFMAKPDLEHYGYELMKATGIKSGTLYPFLSRLEADGFLTARRDASRHYYKLTTTGLRLAEAVAKIEAEQDLAVFRRAHGVAPPGTRYVVIEIPPEASDIETYIASELILESVDQINRIFTNATWDLFAYRQHSEPPFERHPKPISDAAVAAAAREFFGAAYGRVGDEGNRVLHDSARAALEAARYAEHPRLKKLMERYPPDPYDNAEFACHLCGQELIAPWELCPRCGANMTAKDSPNAPGVKDE